MFRNKLSQQAVTRVISFTSGKGGVGKTTTAINFAIALARIGKSVLLLDADLGLANVDVMLGISAKKNIADVVSGKAAIEDIMLSGPDGISVIPASSGVEALSALTHQERLILMQKIEEVAIRFDYLLIDTAAGIGKDVLQFTCASREVICILNPEPTSLTDAYALIKVLSSSYGERSVSVLVNNVRASGSSAELEAKAVFNRLSKAVARFLHVDLRYLGFVPADESVVEAIRRQRALLEVFPSSAAGLANTNLARKLDENFIDNRLKGGMQFFFKQVLEMADHGGQ